MIIAQISFLLKFSLYLLAYAKIITEENQIKMKKILILATVITIGLVSFGYVGAKPVANQYNLDDNQLVIIDQPLAGAVPILKTSFYKITVGELKNNQNKNVNILPVLKYKTNMTVNDNYEPQGYLTLLNSEAYWDSMPDSSGQIIAVVDGGFALNHEDLTGRWYVNGNEFGTTEIEGVAPNCTSRSLPLDKSCNNLDDDLNGYIDDWRGWDFINVDNDPLVGTTNPVAEGVNHATVVAGLVGATGNNTFGSASLNWQSKIMPLQIFSDDGQASSLELAEALAYAIDNGASVINLSLGSTESDPLVDYLLEEAMNAGVVVVAASGNCGGDSYLLNGCDNEGQMLYPASSDFVVAVGATDLDDIYADFSSRGAMLDVVAPGSGAIITSDYSSLNPTNLYSAEVYGTSFSTPIVSSLVASLKTNWPEATFNDIRSVLIDSAYKPAGMANNLFTTSYGFGRIRPLEATNLASNCRSTLLKSDYNCDSEVSLLDLSLLASQWQKQYTGRTDSNNSGVVDLLDLSLLASQWGQ